MSVMRHAAQWGGMRVARRLSRSIPVVGAGIALLTLGVAVRRKGLARGLANAGLDAIPFVGAAKNVIELARGDMFPDRPRAFTSFQPPSGPALRR